MFLSHFLFVFQYVYIISIKNCSLYTLLMATDRNSKNHKKGNIDHNNIAWVSMLLWLILPFYDFCCFQSVAVNSVYKLQFFYIYLFWVDIICRSLDYVITAIFKKWGIKRVPTYEKLCCLCMSVFLSLTSRYYNKVAKHRMQTMTHDSTQINCCFWYL